MADTEAIERSDRSGFRKIIPQSPIFKESEICREIHTVDQVPPDPFLAELYKPVKFNYKCVNPPNFRGPVRNLQLRSKLDEVFYFF